ncbi:YdcF family protein [soil metagenome]
MLPSPNRRLLKWAAILLCAGILFLSLLWICRAPLLRTVAHTWIIDEPPGHADVIVILGGGVQYRAAKAAELYQAGVAPLILIPEQVSRPTDALNVTILPHDASLLVLTAKGVPRSAIELMDTTVRTTKEEADAVHKWAIKHHPHKIVIPTDIWHTRRTHWIFQRILGDATQVTVVAVNPDEYTLENWWQKEQGLIFFEVEVSKMIFYWFNY